MKKTKERLKEIIELISGLDSRGFKQLKPSNEYDDLDELIIALNGLGLKFKAQMVYIEDQEKRIGQLLEALLHYTKMDFSQKLEISERGDELDAIAVGINTVVEELEAHIHGLYEANKELIEKSEKLYKSGKQMEQFAYITSHDLQEPLRTIRNYVDFLEKMYGGKFDEDGEKSLNFIKSATIRMQNLVRDLLEYSKIGHTPTPESINCEMLIKEIADDLQVSIRDTGTKLEYATLPTITASPEIRIVFLNLISNAIKFRNLNVPCRILISAHEAEDNWVFSVADNGIGIEKIYHDRIFTIFQRLHSLKEYDGTGIGLAQCKKLVELYNGKIWLESELGKGSTFYFSIPKISS